MVEGFDNLNLPKNVLHGLLVDDLYLVHILHSVHLLGVFLLDNAHLPVAHGDTMIALTVHRLSTQ